MYSWITRHPQVFQSPISNDFLKVMFDDQTEPQLVPKLLLEVSVRELYNRLVSDPMMVVSKMLDMKMIILLSVILHCVHCFHHNLKNPHDAKSCVVVKVSFLQPRRG